MSADPDLPSDSETSLPQGALQRHSSGTSVRPHASSRPPRPADIHHITKPVPPPLRGNLLPALTQLLTRPPAPPGRQGVKITRSTRAAGSARSRSPRGPRLDSAAE
ncbi:hypothetical protein NDU88_012230 [Pleurodeles waltl]|uniref:Uncharacterized protein n=1 Tax=Pleurodeles waltl TaxID=8319 RepID=A0AAV7QZJ5_PLEWA|nr:hypothetical protein NDU88_012230 [Pleurodeles waltl]